MLRTCCASVLSQGSMARGQMVGIKLIKPKRTTLGRKRNFGRFGAVTEMGLPREALRTPCSSKTELTT